MLYVGLDPGWTIGVGWYNTLSRTFDGFQSKDVHEVIATLDPLNGGLTPVTIVVEDYLSAGSLTKDAKHTIELLGYFYYFFEASGFEVRKVAPQSRKSQVAFSRDLCQSRGIPGPHSWDALAHALNQARKDGYDVSSAG